ncbi:glycosyltransferase [Hymenobacter sp. BT491]|uniref:glycosyltransferase n=1 Tax=Hymenobacter sp. BT491 TaxID=2766779 RepID=UPI001653C487|nr:glycosyltransferase [Hymenobacter sp. BT491]MBC6990049.1 glycosyltransferase [Hymenobacter sp. BT491]
MASSPLLLASVLKPVDDTRMFEKFGRTLASRPDLAVHIAGRRAPYPRNAPSNLHTHELLDGSRLSWRRLAAQWRYWKLLRTLQPALVVVHAPELLPLTLLWQRFGRGRRFLYDVRENYALNILTQQVYPHLVRQVLAKLVRWAETKAARQAYKVILAERSYAEELPFALPERTVILENKYQPQPHEVAPQPKQRLPAPHEPLHLLYSGTISELNGVLEALEFTRQLRTIWPGAHLTIVGFCQQPALLARLQAAIANAPGSVTLIGGDRLVPHADIISAIRRAHVGLLPYRPHPSTWRCLPTKLFEYVAHGLPVIIPDNTLWINYLQNDGIAVVCRDFTSMEAVQDVAAALSKTRFYPHGIPADVLWQSEATKLWAIVDSLQ